MEYYYQIPDYNGIWSPWPLTTTGYPGQLDKSGYAMFPKNTIRPDLRKELERIGLEPRNVAFFYIPPQIGPGVIHIDTTEQDDIRSGTDHSAINWVLTDRPWVMNYFQPNFGTVDDVKYTEQRSYTEINSDRPYSYTKFNIDDMVATCRFSWITNPMLIRTDEPHNVEMLPGKGPRFCASIRLKNNDFNRVKSIFEEQYKK